MPLPEGCSPPNMREVHWLNMRVKWPLVLIKGWNWDLWLVGLFMGKWQSRGLSMGETICGLSIHEYWANRWMGRFWGSWPHRFIGIQEQSTNTNHKWPGMTRPWSKVGIQEILPNYPRAWSLELPWTVFKTRPPQLLWSHSLPSSSAISSERCLVMFHPQTRDLTRTNIWNNDNLGWFTGI